MFGQIQSVFDYVIIAVIVFSILFGFFSGFIRTILSLARFVLSVAIAIQYTSYVVPAVSQHIANKEMAEYSAFIITFLFMFIILSIIKYYIVSLLEIIDRGAVDRTLGVAFGLLRGIIIVSLTYIMITSFTGALKFNATETSFEFSVDNNKLPVWIKSSGFKVQLESFSRFSLEIMPQSLILELKKIIVMPAAATADTGGEKSSLFGQGNKDEGVQILRRFPEDFKKIEPLLKQLKELPSPDEKLKTISEIHNVYMNTISKDVSYVEHKKVLEYFDFLEKRNNQGQAVVKHQDMSD